MANLRAEWGTGFISFDPRNYPKTQKICPLTDRGHPYPIFSRGPFPSPVPGSWLSTEKELEICSLAGVEPDARELRCPVPVPTLSTSVGECRGQTAEGKTPLSYMLDPAPVEARALHSASALRPVTPDGAGAGQGEGPTLGQRKRGREGGVWRGKGERGRERKGRGERGREGEGRGGKERERRGREREKDREGGRREGGREREGRRRREGEVGERKKDRKGGGRERRV